MVWSAVLFEVWEGTGRVQSRDSHSVQRYELSVVRAQQSERVCVARAARYGDLHEDEREVAGDRDDAGDGRAGHDVQEEVRLHTARGVRAIDSGYHSRRSQVEKKRVWMRASHFVRGDELEISWKIFTPLLHELEEKKIKPIPYVRGSRGPEEADLMRDQNGFVRSTDYEWNQPELVDHIHVSSV